MSSLMPRLPVGAFFTSTHPNSIENPLFLPTLLMSQYESMLLRVGTSPTLAPIVWICPGLYSGALFDSAHSNSNQVTSVGSVTRAMIEWPVKKKAPEVSKAVGRIQFFDANYICLRVTFLELRAIPYTEFTSQLIAPLILSFLWLSYRPFVATSTGFNPF